MANGATVGILAVTWPIKIIRVDTSSSTNAIIAARVTGASFTGGTAITPAPARQLPGVPAAVATAKSGTTVSGTNGALGTYLGTYTPATALYVNVGSAFTVVNTIANSIIVIYCEEIHLALSV